MDSLSAINASRAVGGDTILLSSGTYGSAGQSFVLSKSGSYGSPIIIRGNGAIITGGPAHSDGNESLRIAGSDLILEGLTFRPSPAGLALGMDGTRCIVRQCVFEGGRNYPAGTPAYMVMVGGNYNVVTNNTIRNCDDYDAFRVTRNGRNAIISHNIIANMTESNGMAGEHGDVLQIHGPSVTTNILFEGNLAIDCPGVQAFQITGGYGDGVSNIRDINIRGNVFVRCWQAHIAAPRVNVFNNTFYMANLSGNPYNIGIYGYPGRGYGISSGRIENNAFIGNRLTATGRSNQIVVHSGPQVDFMTLANNYIAYLENGQYVAPEPLVTPAFNGSPGTIRGGDPRFMNAGGLDFRLQIGSVLVNAGKAQVPAFRDMDFVMRPIGGAWDIGAYEFGEEGPAPPRNLRIADNP